MIESNRVAAVLIALGVATGASCSNTDDDMSDTDATPPATVVQADQPNGAEPPPQATPSLLDASPIGDPITDHEQSIAPGQRHLLPMDLHCGMTYLTAKVNGRFWVLTASPQGPTPETGAGDTVPPDWPTGDGGLLGYVSITDSDEILYTLPDGRVIGV